MKQKKKYKSFNKKIKCKDKCGKALFITWDSEFKFLLIGSDEYNQDFQSFNGIIVDKDKLIKLLNEAK